MNDGPPSPSPLSWRRDSAQAEGAMAVAISWAVVVYEEPAGVVVRLVELRGEVDGPERGRETLGLAGAASRARKGNLESTITSTTGSSKIFNQREEPA